MIPAMELIEPVPPRVKLAVPVLLVPKVTLPVMMRLAVVGLSPGVAVLPLLLVTLPSWMAAVPPVTFGPAVKLLSPLPIVAFPRT